MNCTGYPQWFDEIDTHDDKRPVIINIQRNLKTGLVKTSKGKVFPVTLQNWLVDGIMLHDYVELKKSGVTGEWIVTNYFINNEVYGQEQDRQRYIRAC